MPDQHAGDVDALAAGVDVGAVGAVDLAHLEAVDLERAVEARVGGQGDDHAVTTRGSGGLELLDELGLDARCR